MSDVTIAVLDVFHPQIEAAIKAVVPANWRVERSIENMKSVLRGEALPMNDIAVAPNSGAAAIQR